MIEASRELACLGHAPGVMNEEIHKVFVGACSESNHLPIGEVRDLWNPQVLQEKDWEIADIEARWKKTESSTDANRFWRSNVRGWLLGWKSSMHGSTMV